MEEAIKVHQNQSLELGLEFQTSKTSSFASDLKLQNPNRCDDDNADEMVLQIIGEELRNLVLSQVLIEESVKGDFQHAEVEKVGETEIRDVTTVEERLENEIEDVKGYGWDGVGDGEYGYDQVEIGDENRSGSGYGYGNENENGYGVGFKAGGYNANRKSSLNLPLRPDAEDCAFYMKTGLCKYGLSCKFNHPYARRNQQFAKERGKQREESQERPGRIECKYYQTSGGCKYGKACKYNHSREKGSVSPILEFNFLGLPIRQGEKECPYYMRTGSCSYGSNCRFHHPDPTIVGVGGDSSSIYNNGGSVPVQDVSHTTVSSWSPPRALNETTPFVPMMYPPTQDIPSNREWNGYQAPVYPTSEKSLPTPPAFSMNNPATETNFYHRPQQPLLLEEYPERPGQPECSYFVKTGDCKYKFNCKFHHPKTLISNTNPSVLSDKGLPLRPDQSVCSFYSRYGICKFGPACKFDHPENYGN